MTRVSSNVALGYEKINDERQGAPEPSKEEGVHHDLVAEQVVREPAV